MWKIVIIKIFYNNKFKMSDSRTVKPMAKINPKKNKIKKGKESKSVKVASVKETHIVHENTVTSKKITTLSSKKRSVPSVQTSKTNKSSPIVETPDVITDDVLNECISLIIEIDPNQERTKAALIETLENMVINAIKNPSLYNNNRRIAIRKVLSDLKVQYINTSVIELDKTREQQNKLINKIDENVFKQKIDLTAATKIEDKESQIKVFCDSKKFWEIESKRRIAPPPKEKEAVFKKTRGNRKLPKDIEKQIYG
jgi:hypothetical protein